MTLYPTVPTILGLSALLLVYTFSRAAFDIYDTVSPQGCRMSWMSPSYILQTEFNSSWTPLASRYSLWLYREVGWEPNQAHGLPVLFIPGNAGSSHQVRSIASSASRQYFASPFVISNEFQGRGVRPLDFFAVEFNEDLSAFHGPTLDSQISYTSAAIAYILSHYPANTRIIIMGHSMGGIVGTALLPSEHISALITMSTPHTLPPARFDSRIDEIYKQNDRLLEDQHTPVLSICGGATDTMIPSESCVLPISANDSRGNDGLSSVYRRTVFTSALEGAWTGVGHREMVWCHQVRWRIARAALELGSAKSGGQRGVILDRWLRDGHILPPAADSSPDAFVPDESSYEILPEDMHLVLKNPRGSRMYLLPALTGSQFVLYVSQGTIPPVSPQNAISLRASVYFCVRYPPASSASHPPLSCSLLPPTKLQLLPNPIRGKPFPVPNEGSDESEGVVLFEGDVPLIPLGAEEAWIGVDVDGADDGGWVVGGFDEGRAVANDVGLFGLAFGGTTVKLSHSKIGSLRTRISFPNLLSNTLVVYRLTSSQAYSSSSCAEPLLAPLLMHSSSSAETHYYPLHHSKPVPLHTHSSSPYIPSVRSGPSRGVYFTIYTSDSGCSTTTQLALSIDWWATLGRMGTRYPTTLVSWSVGVVALVLFHAWGDAEKDRIPSVQQSLSAFAVRTLPKLLPVSFMVALISFESDYYLGTEGEPAFAIITPLLLLGATGLVCVSWWLLAASLWLLSRVGRILFGSRRRQDAGYRRGTLVSMVLLLVLIFVLIPWQVAFLGCWIIQFQTCISDARTYFYPGTTPTVSNTPITSIPLLDRSARNEELDEDEGGSVEPQTLQSAEAITSRLVSVDAYNQNTHILLLMAWLLPFAAPVLLVWVRTLLTAGFTAPFNGDHNFLKVAPFLVLVDHVSRGGASIVQQSKGSNFPTLSMRWGFLAVAGVATLLGGRQAYRVYDAVNGFVAGTILVRVALRYATRR
ncbi:PGAP1-domain-containing protein [Leucogyrophana mollusca]|uniref:PGAP1-domain-containing protein n=1 Tax=Leucogyrophana mollusca TaxID=85980 RepID=A0ACB8AY89_9AGAM|nr:PGAP1-domain-containing protein [Leucogyrophana mollusca]